MPSRCFKWKDSGAAFVVAPRYKEYELCFNPTLDLKKWPSPFRLKIVNSGSEPGQFLDQLALSVAFPKVLSSKAAAVLEDVLSAHGTFWPLDIEGAPRKYEAWIPQREVPALDLKHSNVTQTAFVSFVRKPVVDLDKTEGNEIFLLRGYPFAGVFVSECFVKRVRRTTDLIGLSFEPVETTQMNSGA